MPYSVGGTTKNTFRYGPEVHKLHLEFEIETGTIHRGMPVMLNASGKIEQWDGGNAVECIGVSIHEGRSAYGDLIVVAMRGYVVLDAVASVDGTVTAGPVKFPADVADAYVPGAEAAAYDPANLSVPGARTAVGTSDPDVQGSNAFASVVVDQTFATTVSVIGWSLTPSAIAGAPILVCIMN